MVCSDGCGSSERTCDGVVDGPDGSCPVKICKSVRFPEPERPVTMPFNCSLGGGGEFPGGFTLLTGPGPGLGRFSCCGGDAVEGDPISDVIVVAVDTVPAEASASIKVDSVVPMMTSKSNEGPFASRRARSF